jgi:hypothetical protein
MMLLSVPVILYQLFFVALLFVASRFGSKALVIALACCLLWTATHVFFLPLALLQAGVIVSSYLLFRGAASRNSQIKAGA